MEDNTSSSLKGQFLVAMPKLLDPNFHETVTCLVEFTSEGALGIIVNRVFSALSGRDIFEELKIVHGTDAGSIPVYVGGPVQRSEISVLHGPPFDWRGCYQVTPTLAMSKTRDILEAIGANKGPECFIISLGCAGWGPDQLDSEIKENTWLTCDMAEEIIFRVPVEERWERTLRGMGIDPATLSDIAGHA